MMWIRTGRSVPGDLFGSVEILAQSLVLTAPSYRRIRNPLGERTTPTGPTMCSELLGMRPGRP